MNAYQDSTAALQAGRGLLLHMTRGELGQLFYVLLFLTRYRFQLDWLATVAAQPFLGSCRAATDSH
eukprot:5323529-Amphidinium_carterae.1